MTRKLSTGFYQPTESFKSIPEHIAVMFEDDQTLVAIVGAVDDDVENVKDSIEYAKLFAAAPETLQKLSHALATIAAQSAEIAELRSALEIFNTRVTAFLNPAYEDRHYYNDVQKLRSAQKEVSSLLARAKDGTK